MSEQESATITPPASQSEQDSAMEAQSKDNHHDSVTNNKPSQLSFSIWPPAQRTRDAVVNRLIETLSTPSVLSNRYGTLPQDEASAAARLIEEEAFASAASSAASEDDGIQILQVYSKEISKRMLDAVKARNASASAVSDGASLTETADPPSDDQKVKE